MARKPKISDIANEDDQFLGGLRKVILSAQETDGDIYLVQGIMPEGSKVPVHIHELEDEIFHVLEGAVELVLGDEVIQAKEGAVVYLPRGIKHGIKTYGKQTAKVLNYVIPGSNFETFFEKMNRIGLEASIEEKAKLAKEHHITFL